MRPRPPGQSLLDRSQLGRSHLGRALISPCGIGPSGVGPSEQHAQVDTDGTGEIDFLEFGRMMQPEKRIFQARRPAASSRGTPSKHQVGTLVLGTVREYPAKPRPWQIPSLARSNAHAYSCCGGRCRFPRCRWSRCIRCAGPDSGLDTAAAPATRSLTGPKPRRPTSGLRPPRGTPVPATLAALA